MTRAYPMEAAGKFEKSDHPHHRSLWMTHGDVNGTDFWLEGGEGGVTAHQEFTQLSDGEQAVVSAKNLWQTADGKPILTEVRRYTFFGDGNKQILDCEFKLSATHGDVNFGDTKEGSFGMRIAGSMKVEAEQGGVLTNNHGDKNSDAWGKRAEWVDYVGPIDGEQMGIAILCHPTTFNFPNRWHVRTYGLFAANPFGVHHFENSPTPTDGVALASGDSLVLRYRVLLHRGDTKAADVEGEYATYAAQSFDAL
jgi:hypothetical protein